MKQNNINYLIPEGVSIGVYKITAPDGHYYIGSTNNLKERILRHFSDLRNNRKIKDNKEWQYRYNAHLDWIWTYELLEQCFQEDQLLTVEQKYLDLHYGLPLCLNVNPFATKPPSAKGRVPSLETISKISATNILTKKKNPMSIENRIKISFSNKTRIVSEETRKKMSDALKARHKKQPQRHSIETRSKISASKKGVPNLALKGKPSRKWTAEQIAKRTATRQARKSVLLKS